jgi:hypothetical protein
VRITLFETATGKIAIYTQIGGAWFPYSHPRRLLIKEQTLVRYPEAAEERFLKYTNAAS